jgi:hypothetical protein
MSPNYLQTADAYRDYFSHLTDDGILHINHHVFPRMVTTAALAWRQMGRTDFQRHVVVLGMATERDSLPTFLIRMRPWTEAEVADLMTLFAIRTGNEFAFNLLQDPLHPERSFLPPVFFEGSLPDEVLAKAGSQVRPTTDNRPFFNFLRKAPRRRGGEPRDVHRPGHRLHAQLAAAQERGADGRDPPDRHRRSVAALCRHLPGAGRCSGRACAGPRRR